MPSAKRRFASPASPLATWLTDTPLGFGDVKPRPVPMLVKGLVNLNVASVSCGNHHTGQYMSTWYCGNSLESLVG